jgi:hypothetical protein
VGVADGLDAWIIIEQSVADGLDAWIVSSAPLTSGALSAPDGVAKGARLK